MEEPYIFDVEKLDKKRIEELFEERWNKCHYHLFGDLGYALKTLAREYWDARGEIE